MGCIIISLGRVTAKKVCLSVLLLVVSIFNVIVTSLLLRNFADIHQPLDSKNERNYAGKNGFHEDRSNADPMVVLEFANMSQRDSITQMQKNHIFGRPAGCPGNDTFITALVISKLGDSFRRQAIRNSWARATSVENRTVHTAFVVGHYPDSRTRHSIPRLNTEISKYKDILKGQFNRDPGSGPLALLGIRWILKTCHQVRYILVVHDNMFVNYRRLLKLLNQYDAHANDRKLLIGNIKRGQIPLRIPSSSHLVSVEEFNESTNPLICISSAGYVMNIAAARAVYNYSSSTNNRLFPFTEILTGVVERSHNWTLINHHKLFTTTRMRAYPFSVDHIVSAIAPDNPNAMVRAVNQLNNLTNLLNSRDPDLELVLPSDINNKAYLDEVLRLNFEPPDICFLPGGKNRDIFMVVFINSHPRNSEIRKAIRTTWGSELSVNGESIRLLFIVGKQKLSANTSDVKNEALQHQDVLQANFIDSVANRTLKVITGLRWITNKCTHARYIYVGDEDRFINLKSVVRYLKELRSKREVWNRLYIGSKIYGNGRLSVKGKGEVNMNSHKVPDKLYRGRYYPPYCSVSGYILSSDVAPSMYRMTLRTPLIAFADVFQGILAKWLHVEPVGHRGFKTWRGRFDVCSLRSDDTLTVRGITSTPEQLYQVWATFTNRSIMC